MRLPMLFLALSLGLVTACDDNNRMPVSEADPTQPQQKRLDTLARHSTGMITVYIICDNATGNLIYAVNGQGTGAAVVAGGCAEVKP